MKKILFAACAALILGLGVSAPAQADDMHRMMHHRMMKHRMMHHMMKHHMMKKRMMHHMMRHHM
jgi:hypothetical protein